MFCSPRQQHNLPDARVETRVIMYKVMLRVNEVCRKAEEKSKLGLLLALVSDFEQKRDTLSDPSAWLRNSLCSLREPTLAPHASQSMAWRTESELSARNDGVQ